MRLDYDIPTTLKLIAEHLMDLSQQQIYEEDLICLEGDINDLRHALHLLEAQDLPSEVDDNTEGETR